MYYAVVHVDGLVGVFTSPDRARELLSPYIERGWRGMILPYRGERGERGERSERGERTDQATTPPLSRSASSGALSEPLETVVEREQLARAPDGPETAAAATHIMVLMPKSGGDARPFTVGPADFVKAERARLEDSGLVESAGDLEFHKAELDVIIPHAKMLLDTLLIDEAEATKKGEALAMFLAKMQHDLAQSVGEDETADEIALRRLPLLGEMLDVADGEVVSSKEASDGGAAEGDSAAEGDDAASQEAGDSAAEGENAPPAAADKKAPTESDRHEFGELVEAADELMQAWDEDFEEPNHVDEIPLFE